MAGKTSSLLFLSWFATGKSFGPLEKMDEGVVGEGAWLMADPVLPLPTLPPSPGV